MAVLGGILALQGKADLGSLASYLVFVRQAALPINQFTQQSNFLLAALAGAERVFKVMDLEPEVDEGKVELVRTTDSGRKGNMDSSSKWKYEGIEKEINSVVPEGGNNISGIKETEKNGSAKATAFTGKEIGKGAES